jgi:hypothetical protein
MKKFTDKLNESVEDKIPTANELFQEYHGFEADSSSRDIINLMIEFAKIHVEACKKEISEKAELTDFAYEFLQEGASDAIDKDSILNAYPLENIK